MTTATARPTILARSRPKPRMFGSWQRAQPYPLFRLHDPDRPAYVDAMGLVRADVTFRKFTGIYGKGPSITRRFLVDSGAEINIIPRELLDELEIEPQDSIRIELADGSVVEMEFGVMQLEIGGFDGIDLNRVGFGEAGTEPLLGVETLQSMNLLIHPKEHRLVVGPPKRAGNGRVAGRPDVDDDLEINK